jgi:hypothetical protein
VEEEARSHFPEKSAGNGAEEGSPKPLPEEEAAPVPQQRDGRGGRNNEKPRWKAEAGEQQPCMEKVHRVDIDEWTDDAAS